MAVEKKARKLLPPYVAYTTFKNFLERLRSVGLPDRIDRSVMAHLSGGVQSQLDASFRYLGLINQVKMPTERLEQLVQAEGDGWKAPLRAAIKDSYPFLFGDGLDLERATSQQVHEKFSSAGAGGETIRKCIAFFISAAKDSDLPISPHIQVTKGGASKPAANKKPKQSKPPKDEKPGAGAQHQPHHEPAVSAWESKLLDKFPEFNPEWPDEAKSEWLKAFNDLMQMRKSTV